MATVEGIFPDYSRHNYKGSFRLTSDQDMNPYTWVAPINWSGYINETEVHFVQTSSSGSSRSDYDFSTIPEKYNSALSDIIQAIDKAMKIMD